MSPLRLRLLALVLLLLVGGPLAAEEERAPACDLSAVRLVEDARLLQIYDGLRKGLERAHLPRVCFEPVKDDETAFASFGRRLALQQARAAQGQGQAPVAFAFGDAAAKRLQALVEDVPRVLVLTRYTAAGRPLLPLPEPKGRAAVVFAETRLEHLAHTLRRMLDTSTPVIAFAWSEQPSARAGLERALDALGARVVAPEATDPAPQALLHVRLGVGETLMPFPKTLALARERRIVLVSDDPARYRRGRVPVVLSGDHDLVGRHAAELARQLLQHPETRPPVRRVTTSRVLVDLRAADAHQITLPLAFLAGAYSLRRGLPAPGSRVGR
jgi:hypothetical protein